MKIRSILLLAVGCVGLIITIISCSGGYKLAKSLLPIKDETLSNSPVFNMDEPSENFLNPSPVATKEITTKTQEEVIPNEALEYLSKKNIPPKKDGNGVIIEKRNGTLITNFPNGEVYYLPDEL